MSEFRLETERLALRSWRAEGLDPFHAICSDPLVMATLGPCMSRAETAALIGRVEAIEREHGHTFWALERLEDSRLIGWCGVTRGRDRPIDGKAEIGWRLASDCWGQGYASEAARASLDWLFANLPDDAAWAIAHTGNHRSRAVMERLGMTYRPEFDFDHPRLAADDPLLRHVAYSLERSARPAR
ncbi:MAG: GNAT family N-acetyltransferase [Novosphingobium sp.]|nr:GNAT family N-acetyltransferase [Novosphingobium sp.]